MRLQILLLLVCFLVNAQERWSEERAKEWYSEQEWSAGINFTPAYADNEIELWEHLDFDQIDKELGWAH